MQQTSWARDLVPVSAFNPPFTMRRTWDGVVMLWFWHDPRSPNSWPLQSDRNILQASCHERHPTRGCPLQKLISTNQSTDVYRPVQQDFHDSVLVGCSIDSVATNQEGIVGPSSCLSLSNNASQFWYLVLPETDMSTLPLGCEVVAKFIPIPYTYDKNGPKFQTFFGKPLFKDRAKGAINLGETPLNWSLTSITSICQRCEQEGRHCGFSSNHGQAFCLNHGIVFPAQITYTIVVFHFKL